ncbi:hypothetical protein MMC25_008165 [Agyrium rufum]|nr:hypothetical protein [Agyrium rufum]
MSGFVVCVSHMAMPTLANLPPYILARRWRTSFEIGKATGRPLNMIPVVCFISLAYMHYRDEDPRWKSYALAAVLNFALAPYTAFVLGPINSRLLAMAQAGDRRMRVGEGGKGELGLWGSENTDEKLAAEVDSLVKSWAVRNYWRATLPFMGAVVAAWTSLA